MSEQYGIEAIKAEVKLGFDMFNAIKSAKADGSINMADLPLLVGLVPSIQAAYEKRLGLGVEFKDLSVDEAAQVAAYIAGQSGAAMDAALQAKIVAVINFLKAGYEGYKAFA